MPTSPDPSAAKPNAIHAFEQAGLGKAPFHIIGCSDKVGPFTMTGKDGVTYMVGSPGQPMGVCKFCGTGIKECWAIKSADGNVFDVGCDCVRKTGDAGLKKVIDAELSKRRREKAHAKGDAHRAYVDSVLADSDAMVILASQPHPMADKPWFATKTAADFVTYMRQNCGDSGIGRLAKWLRAVLESEAAHA